MPYFNLDPKTAMPWDIIGCILFPNNDEMALLSAVYDLVKIRSGNIKLLEKIDWPPREKQRSIDETWGLLRRELEKHGGLGSLVKLLNKVDFHKEYRRAMIEGMIAGKILRTAIQVDHEKVKVTRKKTFMLVEEEINRAETMNGIIFYHGERIKIKRSEKRLNDCWRSRSCVAHWWAALDVMLSLEDSLESNPYLMDNIPTLAAISNGFLAAGSRIMIRDQSGNKQPFIISEEAWQLGDIGRDHPQVNVLLYLPPLEDWAKKLIVYNQ